MHHRQLLVLASLASLTVAIRPSGAAEPPKTHPGQIVDFDRGTPIEAAAASAYATQDREGEGACPTFKDRLSVDKSDAGGGFKFSIDRATYSAVYCKPGYHPRVDPDNKNDDEGQPVQPKPIRLMPVSADVPAYRALVARHLSAFLSDLRYLQQARPEQFREALREASETTLHDPFFAQQLESTLARQNQKR